MRTPAERAEDLRALGELVEWASDHADIVEAEQIGKALSNLLAGRNASSSVIALFSALLIINEAAMGAAEQKEAARAALRGPVN